MFGPIAGEEHISPCGYEPLCQPRAQYFRRRGYRPRRPRDADFKAALSVLDSLKGLHKSAPSRPRPPSADDEDILYRYEAATLQCDRLHGDGSGEFAEEACESYGGVKSKWM